MIQSHREARNFFSGGFFFGNLCFVILLCLAAVPLEASPKTVRITNGEWAPYLSEHLPEHGFASHVVKAAFAAEGIEVEYGFFPWRRSYKLAKEGIWHGSVVWVYTEKRARDFYYSDPVIIDNEYLFHLKTFNLSWERVEDLKGLTIGGTLHTVYPIFDKAADQGLISMDRSGTYENLYRRLLKERIHAIPQVSKVGQYLIRTTLTPEEQSRITLSPTIIQTRKYALILSKAVPENKRLVEDFNRGLERIRSSGLYGRLSRNLDAGFYDPKDASPSSTHDQ